MEEDTVYFIDPEQFEMLVVLRTELFGNGSRLSPDKRRDLANTLDVLVEEIRHQTKE